MRLATFLLLALSLVLGGMLRADEAARTDGKPVAGSLTLEKTGKLQFTPAAPGEKVSLADVTEFRLDSTAPPPFRAAPGMLLVLHGGQQLTGVFLGIQKNTLLFRTAWAERLSVPRSAARVLRRLPGWRPVVVEELRTKPAGWMVQGAPSFGTDGFVLDRAGQSLTRTLSPAVAEGRIGVTFRDSGGPGGRWQVEAVFADGPRERLLRVTVAGGDALTVDAGGLAGTLQKVDRAAGPRRLVLRFTTGSLVVCCDDSLLWYTLKQGPGGPLRRVRLACISAQKDAALGSAAFSDLVVERAVAEKRRPPGEPGQDELWLAGGDQLFGEVVAADAKGVQIKTRFGSRRFAWPALRGWFLKKPPPSRAIAASGGPAVTLWLRSGLRAELDLLEGTLIAMDAHNVTLRHALLGELRIPRPYVARLRPPAAEQ